MATASKRIIFVFYYSICVYYANGELWSLLDKAALKYIELKICYEHHKLGFLEGKIKYVLKNESTPLQMLL